MKLTARFIKRLYNDKQQAEVTLLVENFRHASYLDELEQDVEYSVEIKKIKSKRSIQSNKFLWAMLHQLEVITRELAIDWYIKSLVDTGAKIDYIWGATKTEDILNKSFRAIQRVKFERMKKLDGYWYRVIVGSSKFNQEEMTLLLDTVIRYCHEHQIETELLNV